MQELKSIYRIQSSDNRYQVRGAQSEKCAIQYFEQKLRHIFIVNHFAHYYGEIDLLFLSPNGELVLVEVKSASEDLSFRPLVGKSQCLRLKRIFQSLAETSSRSVRMHLAAVNQQGDVHVFEDFLAET